MSGDLYNKPVPQEQWKLQLMNAFSSRAGGVKPTITNIRCGEDPNQVFVYYSHPYFGSTAKAGVPNSKHILLQAYAPDVLEFLMYNLGAVSFPTTLTASIRVDLGSSLGQRLAKSLDMILYAELKAKAAEEDLRLFTSGEPYGASVVAWRFPPYYFVVSKRKGFKTPNTKIPSKRPKHGYSATTWEEEQIFKTVIPIDQADLLVSLVEADNFQEVDHDSLFKVLVSAKPSTLAGLWLICPTYFEVLAYLNAERYRILEERFKKGMLDG